MINLAFGARRIGTIYLAALLFAGCAETTLTPTFRATTGLPRPDRVLVSDFAVTPAEAGIERRSALAVQTDEDVRVGKVLARALSTNLVAELRKRSIESDRAAATDTAGETTASVRGRFLRSDAGEGATNVPVGFALDSRQLRILVQLYQGAGLRGRLVGEGEIIMLSGRKSGGGADDAIDAEAKRIAQAVAERIADYYRQEGWIK